MDPLSVAASISGLLIATAKIYSLLKDFVSDIADAPSLARLVRDEVYEMTLVISQLQPFVLRQASADASRMEMINIDRFLIMLTGTVCTFSELEKEVTGLTGLSAGQKISRRDYPRWAKKGTRISQLFQHLQRHKLSWTLTLNILTW
jgi:hypothetical protein